MTLSLVKSIWTQWFPPAPTFTEKDIGDQRGRVFLITGANSGIGYELARMLYPSGATIYMAGRSDESMLSAIESIKAAHSTPAPETPALLKALHIDLADLASVKKAAEELQKQEDKLDILWNNAGVGGTPIGWSTAQGLECHIGTNCVGPFLLTQLLLPQLRNAAEDARKGSVRVIWTSSAMVDSTSVKGGLSYSAIEAGKTTDSLGDYAASKVGNWFLSVEASKAYSPYGISSVVQNPGNVDTDAYRHMSKIMQWFLKVTVLYESRLGAYTLIYTGLSPEVQNGDFIWPWGRQARSNRQDIHEAIEKGAAEKFWAWCEEKAKPFA